MVVVVSTVKVIWYGERSSNNSYRCASVLYGKGEACTLEEADLLILAEELPTLQLKQR